MSECKHDGGFRYMDPGPLSDDIVMKVCNLCNQDVLGNPVIEEPQDLSASDDAHMDAQGRLANNPEEPRRNARIDCQLNFCGELNCDSCAPMTRDDRLFLEAAKAYGREHEGSKHPVPYFGRDLPALIDVLTTYAKGDGANGCNLNRQEAEKIARILRSHVYG